MGPVSIIRKLCKGFFVEALDKNSSEFIVMCPRLYHILAAGIFQFSGGQLLEGVSYKTTAEFSAVVSGSLQQIPVGTVVHLQLLREECAFFTEFSCTTSAVQGSPARLEGEHFSFNQPNRSWVDIDAVEILNLKQSLQPSVLNKRFAKLWRSMLSKRTPSWGRVRVVPKNKNVAAGRPLGDQSCNPTAILSRALSRFLDLCLRSIPNKLHFDRSTHDAMTETLRAINIDPLETGIPLKQLCNYGILIVSRDIDNGYMRIQHDTALAAWDFLCHFLRELRFSHGWVNPTDSSPLWGPSKFASWSQQSGRSCLQMSIDDVAPILGFLFDNMQFCFGEAKGWQKAGVMMGIGAGGSIVRMVLIAHELQHMLSPKLEEMRHDHPDCSFRVARFVDDIRAFAIFPLHKGEVWASDMASRLLTMVYPKNLMLKADFVNPTVGMEVYVRDGEIHWIAHNRPLGENTHYATRCRQTFVPWYSFGPPHTMDAIAMGGFARCKHLASDVVGLCHSLNRFCQLLQAQDYPRDWILQQLKRWCSESFGSQTKLHKQVESAERPLANLALNRSFHSHEICMVVGQLRPLQL